MADRHSTIAVVGCADYRPALVRQSVNRVFDLLGGIERFVRPGQRVLIKPNLIVPVGPEVPAQTHPEMIAAVAE